jgi:hypothetical protein
MLAKRDGDVRGLLALPLTATLDVADAAPHPELPAPPARPRCQASAPHVRRPRGADLRRRPRRHGSRARRCERRGHRQRCRLLRLRLRRCGERGVRAAPQHSSEQACGRVAQRDVRSCAAAPCSTASVAARGQLRLHDVHGRCGQSRTRAQQDGRCAGASLQSSTAARHRERQGGSRSTSVAPPSCNQRLQRRCCGAAPDAFSRERAIEALQRRSGGAPAGLLAAEGRCVIAPHSAGWLRAVPCGAAVLCRCHGRLLACSVAQAGRRSVSLTPSPPAPHSPTSRCCPRGLPRPLRCSRPARHSFPS